jgi:hypothetical protein
MLVNNLKNDFIIWLVPRYRSCKAITNGHPENNAKNFFCKRPIPALNKL